MQRVLNQEEIDAIVQAARGQTSSGPRQEKSVQSCDFRQAGQLSRELVQAVSGMFEGFARNLSQALGFYLPVAIQTLLVSVEQLTYKDFLVRTPEVTYTRAGTFQLDSQGNLVTADGNPIQPAIAIPSNATAITIGADGTVSVTQPGQTAAQTVGSIQLALFPNPGGLNSMGNNLFLATTASGDPIVGTPGASEGLGTLQQGVLEQSNVNVVSEFIQMILAQRSYESNSRVVRAADEMLQDLNGLTQ